LKTDLYTEYRSESRKRSRRPVETNEINILPLRATQRIEELKMGVKDGEKK